MPDRRQRIQVLHEISLAITPGETLTATVDTALRAYLQKLNCTVGGVFSRQADGSYTAPLGDLVAAMPALTADEAAFVETVLADMPPRPANYEEIIATNLGQESVDDETAFRLELGPNNCAASQGSLAGD